MRFLATCLAVATCARTAHADDLADLEAEGQNLAKQSEFTRAIDAFKAADRLKPLAAHACMIGLAYLRRELWPQAELFLRLCEKRSVPGDQPPAWIDEAEQQLAVKLSAAQIPPVTIVVEPAAAPAKLSVSTFAADETFAPQTIHLVPGRQTIEVTAPGFLAQQREITVSRGEPQTVTFVLRPSGPVVVVAPPVPARPAAAKPFGPKIPWIVMGAGAALVGIGMIYDEAALQPARDHLANAQSVAAYTAYLDDFRGARVATVTLFAVGVGAVGVGAILHYTVWKRAVVTPQVGDHGVAIVVGWRR